MRTSRISQETSKVVADTSPKTRRSTRISLARFAHNSGGKLKNEDSDDALNLPPSLDIEDAISTSRKRKRSEGSTSVQQSAARRIVTVKSEVEDSLTLAPSTKTERKIRKPARTIKNEEGLVEIHPPSDWERVYGLVKEMRTRGSARNAAVDTMGCESLAADDASPRDKRYQTLTALMLSSQTKDTTNALAMKRLRTELPAHTPGAAPGLNLENVLAVEAPVLNELIWAVGFHNNKTRYIKATAEVLRDVWGGDIPDSVEGLTSLPGVGPKMAYLCLSTAWGRDEGIGVDVHVHRITNLWGWHKTKGPEETRVALQAWLPRERWHEINWLLVGFGQTVCLPVGRKCGECELGLQGLCRAAERVKVTAGRRLREERVEQREAGENGVVTEAKTAEIAEEELVGECVVNAPTEGLLGVEGGRGEASPEQSLNEEPKRKANAEPQKASTVAKRRVKR
ncbi:MAG: DNA N-glycosylase and apurinic/apyrimidinic (AP) lyase [Claussenomyces sp. TS43310]|nr:MAG: DNA N-glycosylase and apurinic/apyrimidinic (AP) lyase [Claussenomyces sp. TS43310]